ncbi:MAG TPA: hypothetical protein VN667_05650 [Burkholderiales bacterium]|nr:hypothetical protein [Burkholderiales bacterium]
MQLASDVNNPAFSGAVSNPDSLLSVEFYWNEPLDTWASENKGVPVKLKKMPYIRIAIPGNDKSIIERPASERDAERFPVHWLRFQMKEGLVAGEENVPGWPLGEWTELNEDQVRHLRYLRFQTVEQLAGASDHQVNAVGMGGLALREKARRALAARMDAGVKDEIAKRDATIAAQGTQIAELSSKVAALLARLESGDAKTETKAIKRS